MPGADKIAGCTLVVSALGAVLGACSSDSTEPGPGGGATAGQAATGGSSSLGGSGGIGGSAGASGSAGADAGLGGNSGVGGAGGADASTDAASGGADASTLCVPNSLFCDGQDAKQCSGDGNSASLVKTCAGTEFCDAGACKPQICTPNAPSCNGAVATTCNANGSGYQAGGTDCSLASNICLDGACDVNISNLVAYWRFDDGSGTLAKDSSGNGNHGTVSGASWITGQVGGGLSFDGVDDVVDAGDVLNGVKVPFSVTAWVRVSSSAGQWFMASDDASPFVWYRGWYFGVLADNRVTSWFGDNTCGCAAGRKTRNSLAKFSMDKWMHVAMVAYSGTNLAVFADGAPSNGTISGTATDVAHTIDKLKIGRGFDKPFKGALDEIRVYDRALSPVEVAKTKTGP